MNRRQGCVQLSLEQGTLRPPAGRPTGHPVPYDRMPSPLVVMFGEIRGPENQGGGPPHRGDVLPSEGRNRSLSDTTFCSRSSSPAPDPKPSTSELENELMKSVADIVLARSLFFGGVGDDNISSGTQEGGSEPLAEMSAADEVHRVSYRRRPMSPMAMFAEAPGPKARLLRSPVFHPGPRRAGAVRAGWAPCARQAQARRRRHR